MMRKHTFELRARPLALCLALAGLCGCPGNPQDDAGVNASCAAPDAPRLIVSTNTMRYESGQLAAMGLATGCLRDAIAPASSDAVLALHGAQLVVMNSGVPQDNVTFFDLAGTIPRLTCQLAATSADEPGLVLRRDGGVSGNPRGYVGIDARRGYLARFSQRSLAIVDMQACAITGTIDLSPFQGIAPLPDPRPISRVGDEVWVALERLPPDLANPSQVGAVVRIDPARDAPIDNDPTTAGVQPIELLHANPVGHFALRGTRAWIATVGAYQRADDGAIEEIDTISHAVTSAVTEADLGGNVDAVIVLDDDRLLARVVDRVTGDALDVGYTHLVEWRRSTRIARTWLTVPGYSLTEPVLGANGVVYVGDRGSAALRRRSAILAFDAVTGAEATRPSAPALSPYDLIAVE